MVCWVQDGRLLKQLADTIGGVIHCISYAIKTTEKALLNAKTTRRGVREAFASKLQGTMDKLVSGKQQRSRVDTKSGPHRPHECIHKRAGRKVTFECESAVKVVKDRPVYCAVGEWFCYDIETSLPCIETVMLYDLSVRGYIYG
jgi:hypothetical protein